MYSPVGFSSQSLFLNSSIPIASLLRRGGLTKRVFVHDKGMCNEIVRSFCSGVGMLITAFSELYYERSIDKQHTLLGLPHSVCLLSGNGRTVFKEEDRIEIMALA